MTTPVERGLQIERTGLAWRRTSLGVAVGALVCLKILPPRLGVVGVLLAVLGLAWSADLALVGKRRLRAAVTARDGAVIARTAGIAGLVGLVALVTTIALATRPA